jgi:hypothetical protein
MSTSFTAASLEAEMRDICRLNYQIQKARLPHKKWERMLSKCRCVYNPSNNVEPIDSSDVDFESAHQKITDYGLRRERDALIIDFHNRLMSLSCMHPGVTRTILIFGLTDAGNPAIEIKFDGITLHDRPVTPKTLAPKLADLASCLERYPSTPGPIREFVVSYTDRITATSPEQALWKWICLRHRDRARELSLLPAGAAMPSNETFDKFIRGVSLHETFHTRAYLAGGLGLVFDGSDDTIFPTTPWPFPGRD